jgi:NAD(P)-dependent dehydrogenase (short-subunit alcohol dehydrogenase family)
MAITAERIVIISGGTGGLGLIVSRHFAAIGDRVIVTGHASSESRITALSEPQLLFMAVDGSDEASVSAVVQQIHTTYGRIDVLVNVVGGYAAGNPIHELDLETWDLMMDINLRPTFLFSKHVAQSMIARHTGRIINVASRAGVDLAANTGAYGISKAGIISLTSIQAKELLAYNITVNVIVPSIIDTPANRHAMPNANFDRWPKAEEIAPVISFLASDDAKLISGASIPVYGLG